MDTLERGTMERAASRFQRAEAAQHEQAALEALFKRKNFLDILDLLYREKTMRQKDLAEALGISKGSVCLNMNELDAAGFIRQEKEGRCKTYRLLKKGAEYYETHYPGRIAPDALPRPVETAASVQPRDALSDLLSQLSKSLAEVETLAQALREQQDIAARRSAVQGRHFNTILKLLYEKKIVLKKDMVEHLGISPGNTFLHVKSMIEAGFVEEGRDGISRTYRLSPAGVRYYEEHNLKPGRKAESLEPEQDTRPERAEQPVPVTVLNERNFTNIMQILYETGDIPLSDLCTRLDRPHGNVYRDMQNLTLEGFVKKETVKHCNYYALSDKGRAYCERWFR